MLYEVMQLVSVAVVVTIFLLISSNNVFLVKQTITQLFLAEAVTFSSSRNTLPFFIFSIREREIKSIAIAIKKKCVRGGDRLSQKRNVLER